MDVAIIACFFLAIMVGSTYSVDHHSSINPLMGMAMHSLEQ